MWSLVLLTLLSGFLSVNNVVMASVRSERSISHIDQIQMPLTTKGRYIIDSRGERVKFACMNWVSHMETYLPEGLADRTMQDLVEEMRSLGFNCVRFTMSVEMVKNFSLPIGVGMARAMSLPSQFAMLQLHPHYDPSETTVYDVFSEAMELLKEAGLMVILDNHVSRATWCCGLNDDNRWWDASLTDDDASDVAVDQDSPADFVRLRVQSDNNIFPSEPWTWSLAQMAAQSLKPEWSHIVGVGLRNEVHTLKPNQNSVWYRQMRAGAEAVHAVNPELLVIVGGMSSASYLRQLINEPLFDPESRIRQQIVYEAHFYNLAYIYPLWSVFGESITCRYMKWFLNRRVGFVLEEGQAYTGPLWLSEFGLNTTAFMPDQKSTSDTQWMTCLKSWLDETDADWAYWVLHGHYYFRGKKFDFNEEWGLMDVEHRTVRSPALVDILKSLMVVRNEAM
jgi:hypothetical protein